MSDTLTQLIARVQALLLDTGTNYTTATCTAAIRQALKEYNQVAPVFAGYLLDTVADQREYELEAGTLGDVLTVQSVSLYDSTGNDDDTPLDYVDFWQDNRLYIRLFEPQAAGGQLNVRYAIPNTVNGLDSASETTIPTYFEQTIVNGGAYYAIAIRTTGRVEPINLNSNVPASLRESAGAFLLAFRTGLVEAGRRKPAPVKMDQTWTYAPTEY
jgi:hypothetical protein